MKFASPSTLTLLWLVAPVLLTSFVLRWRQGKGSITGSISRVSLTEMVLRVCGIVLLLLALAEPYSEEVSETSRATVLIDISDSVDEAIAQSLLKKAKGYASETLSLDIIPFAKDTGFFPLSEAESGSFRKVKTSWSKLNIGYTDLENALLSTSSARSGPVLLISDGYETEGNADNVTTRLRATRSKVFPLTPDAAQTRPSLFRISRLHAPLVAPAEKSVDVRVTLSNSTTSEQEAILEVKHDSKTIFKKKVSVSPESDQVFVARSDPSKEGIKEVTATLSPVNKSFPPGSQTVYVSGAEREKVLLISGTAEDAKLLEQVLSDQSYRLENIIKPNRETSFPGLASFSTVILNNAALRQLPGSFPSKLKAYVKNGGSVALLGGNRSFGLGGYINTPIEEISPLRFVPPQTEKKRLNIAVTLILDKSRSMSNNNKIAFAKDAARAVIKNLKDEDYIQVIGFDSTPFIVVPMARLRESRQNALGRINRLFPAGRTNLLPALDEARRTMGRAKAGRKHVIVMTDGKIPFAGAYYIGVVNQLRNIGATVSTVQLGGETDVSMLKAMANAGGGAFYQTTNAASLPNIFLKDVKVASGERTLKENKEFLVRTGTGKLTSTTVLAFPPLLGYVQTKLKKNANLELIVYQDEKAEPLLASWKYGEGKVSSFTSDSNGRWSRFWAGWPKYQRFWSELIDSLRPEDSSSDENVRFDLRYYVEKGSLYLDLSVYSESISGSAIIAVQLPDGTERSIDLKSVSRGRYTAVLENATAGKYALTGTIGKSKLTPVAFHLSGEQFGEKQGQGFNTSALQRLASATGGELNPDPALLQTELHREVKRSDLTYLFVLLGIVALLLEIFKRELFQFRFPRFFQRFSRRRLRA